MKNETRWNKSQTSFPKVKRQHNRDIQLTFFEQLCTTLSFLYIIILFVVAAYLLIDEFGLPSFIFIFFTVSLILYSFTFFSLYRTKFYGSAVHTVGNEAEVK